MAKKSNKSMPKMIKVKLDAHPYVSLSNEYYRKGESFIARVFVEKGYSVRDIFVCTNKQRLYPDFDYHFNYQTDRLVVYDKKTDADELIISVEIN